MTIEITTEAKAGDNLALIAAIETAAFNFDTGLKGICIDGIPVLEKGCIDCTNGIMISKEKLMPCPDCSKPCALCNETRYVLEEEEGEEYKVKCKCIDSKTSYPKDSKY